MSQLKQQAGFTIVELMVATTVFSIVMLIGLAAVTQIGKMYYKGVVTSQTQEVARAISNNIAQSVQLSSGEITSPSGASGSFCVGNVRYSYVLDQEIEIDQPHILWSDTLDNCKNVAHPSLLVPMTATPGGVDGKELMGQNMRLSTITLTQFGTTSLYDLTVGVIYGDTGTLLASHQACSGSYLTAQFCAVTNISTTVKKRL